MSFLNIGSGTGYLSSIVAHILGPTGICYGIEINRHAYDHGISCVQRWKEENRQLELPWMEFIHGNGLNIATDMGESVLGFDRIYVGAAVERSKLSQLTALLRVGGILVGPGTLVYRRVKAHRFLWSRRRSLVSSVSSGWRIVANNSCT
jgi:protein-L-isoaspartate O-methyltransferase